MKTIQGQCPRHNSREIKKKRHQRITCIFSMFQNTFIENVVINIYGVIYALARQ